MLALVLLAAQSSPGVPDTIAGEDPHAPRGYGSFGDGLADIGDVDGDRVDDFTISDPYSLPATIWIVSGRNGQVIDTLCSDDATRAFGRSIAAMSDVDADGAGEIVVGVVSDSDASVPGRAAIYSGRTRTLLRTIDSPAGVSGFASRVDGLSDVDGDEVGDLLVTRRVDGLGTFGFVYSGHTGDLLYELRAPWGVEPRRIDPVGDVDADGFADLAFVGLITRAHSPILRLCSGLDGHLIAEVDTEITSQGVGLQTLAVEEQDGDGLADLLFCSRGVLQVRSAADLRLLRSFETPDLRVPGEPRGVGCVGDIDGDHIRDFVVGNECQLSLPSFSALSGATGAVLWKNATGARWRHIDAVHGGEMVIPIGDINGDGVREFLWRACHGGCGGPGLVLLSCGKTGELQRVFVRGAGLTVQCVGPKG